MSTSGKNEHPDRVNYSIDRAIQFANSLAHEYVTLEHLLYAIIEEQDCSDLLTAIQSDAGAIANEVETFLKERDDIFAEEVHLK